MVFSPLLLLPFLGTLVTATQMFSLLTVPYFVGIHREAFDTGEWGVWMRIFSFAFTTVLSLAGLLASLGSNKYLRSVVAAGHLIGIAATIYNVLFGLRTAQLVACSGLSSRNACMEPAQSLCTVQLTQVLGTVRPWEALLFAFTLCGLLCTLVVGLAVLIPGGVGSVAGADRTTPDSLNQSAWEALTHDNSPGKKSLKVDSIEKSGLIEPVFLPSKRNPPPTNPPDPLNLTNSGEFSSSIGRGRGRGRGGAR